MKILSTKVNIPEYYFGIEFTDVSLYFYEEEGCTIISLLVNGDKLGKDRPFSISLYGDERYSEESILRGVKDIYPDFFVYN